VIVVVVVVVIVLAIDVFWPDITYKDRGRGGES